MAVFRRIALASLLVCGSALAVPFPDEFVGPPSYTLMGCPHDKVWTYDVVKAATGLSDRVLERMKRKYDWGPERVCTIDPRLVPGIADPLPHKRFDEPDKALEQRARQMRDENGVIPPDALLTALAQRQQALEPIVTKSTLLEEKAAGLTSSAWTWLGPGNIGGRVRAISPHPTTPNDIIAGSVSGGLWRTTNGGSSWAALDDFMPNVAVSCLVRDPATPTTIYACTGEGFFNVDAVRGLGIFKSTDNGTTWSQISSTNPATGGTDWYFVNRLAISPTNPAVMLAATNGGLYRTTNGTAQTPTWTKVYQSAGTGRWRSVGHVVFHPTDGNIALLGELRHTNCISTCVTDGSAVAYSADGGATWTRVKLNTSAISGFGGRVEVAFAPSNPSIAYAMVDMSSGQLYKSTDGGATWIPNAPVSTPAHLGSQGWYGNALWVAPNDANRVIIGGVGMKMSLDGGSTWTTIGSSVHVDHHAIVSDPAYASNFTIYNGNDGGIYKATGVNTTAPSGTSPTWTKLNNNLGVTQFYGGAGKAGGRIVGGTQDNGTLMWTGTTNWISMWGNDGGNSAADQSDGNYLYGMTQYGGIVRYTQGLATSPPSNASQYICTGITDASCNFNNSSPRILFIPPMALDTSTNTTLFLGAEKLWRSTNIKDAINTNVSWSIARNSLSTNAQGYIPYITDVAIAPGNANLVWIGYEDGQIACSSNALAATPTWTAVSGGPARYVTRLLIDPSNPNRVFLANGGYTSPNLKVTTSGCTSTPVWTSIHNQLPSAPVRAIQVHPANPSWLYAGTEVGVFTSEDNGAHWTTTNDGPGTVSVEELFWLDSTTLIAATHGRGMYRAAVLPGIAPSITSSPPASGVVNQAYTHTYTANGTPAPTFSLTSGAFPTGLTLNATTGVLSGTPTVAGTFNGVVTATNTSGTATQSFSITIGSTLPGAPTIGTATPGNAQATISFTPPASNGGFAITSYTVTCNPGGITASGAASPVTVTGLTNGVTYTCSVTATNSQGTGPASGTVTVTPTANVPVFTSAAPPSGTVNVAYSHTYTASGSPAPTFTVTSGALPTGLSLNATTGVVSGTPSAAGTFTGVVTATNSNGSGTQSFSIAIAATVPGAPTIGSATPGVGQATVAFTAPASNGGSPITSYSVTCGPGGFAAGGAASPLTVTGLAGGTTYSCFAQANNAVGASAASGTVSVTPYSIPAITSAAPAGGTFGTAYSHTYTATGSPAPTFSVTTGALPGGLTLSAAGALTGTPSAAGTFTGVVTATNAGGSATQNFSIVIAPTVPGAPTIGTATAGNAQASITFTAPASNGGATITSYTATCAPGGITGTGAASPVVVTGLTNGVAYSCSVKATNSAGSSAASGSVSVTPGTAPAFTSAAAPGGTFGTAYSHTFTASGTPAPTFSLTSGALPAGLSLAANGALTGTPSAAGTFIGVVTATNSAGSATQNFSIAIAAVPPGAPTIGTGTAGNTQATIAFTPPASTGGSAITGYTVSCAPGGFTASGAASPITVTGLTNGVTYSCSVQATNAAGTGPASGTVNVTPVAAPVFTSAAPAAGTFGIAYSHTYTANGSPAPTFSVTSGALPTGLSLSSAGALTGTPTATGTFTGVVTATNVAGSATQNFSIVISADVPGAPTIGTATPGNAQATIGFTAPTSNGGAAITGYTATCNPGGITGTGATSPITVSGLTNGVTYTCSVRATNSSGTGPASGTVSVTPGVAPAFTSGAAASGTYGVAYSHTFTASGSPAPTFSVTAGALPTGLSLGSNGAVTGTPTAVGTFSGTVTATNTAGSAGQAFSITIAATVPGAPTIGSATPGNAQASIAFTAPVSNGGSAITGYTATCNPGALSATGASSPLVVTGLTNGVAYTCSVKATNAVGTGAASGTVGVTPGVAPAITSAAPPAGTFGVAYSHTYAASGSPAPTFAVTAGGLPPGLALGAGGALTGTPTTAGTFSGTVTATNVIGSSSQGFSITIAAVPPGAPTIGTATPGNGQASIAFTAPASTGGSAITSYTVTCNPGSVAATAAASPIVVAGLNNNTPYSCSVVATNAAGTGPASGSVSVTPNSGIVLALQSASSRKVHGPFGSFDIALDITQAIAGAVTVEPRVIGSGHKIVFVFNDGIGSPGTPSVVDAFAAPVGSASAVAVGNTVEVTLTGIPDNKRVRVALTGVNGTLNTGVSIGFLVGDVNSTRAVTAADILQIQGRSGQVTSATNFRYDIDASGGVSLSDVILTRGNSGLSIP